MLGLLSIKSSAYHSLVRLPVPPGSSSSLRHRNIRAQTRATKKSSLTVYAKAGLTPPVPTQNEEDGSPTWTACDSILPPLGRKKTTLHQVEDGLWVLRQDFFDANPASNAYNNCFVVKLPGELGNMVISPVSMTEEATYLLKQIPGIASDGVQHIVANSVSPEHWSFVPGLLKQYPDATVWACPGIDSTSRMVGNAGGKDLWFSLLELKRSDGCVPRIRVIENNATPYAPAELGGDVEFAVFASDPPLLQEATMLIKSRHAVVLGDLGFKQDNAVYASLPAFAQLLNRTFKLNNSLAAPIPYPAMVKNPELGAAWKRKVMDWPVWDRLLCCHLQPVVPDGRAELQQCYSFLPRA